MINALIAIVIIALYAWLIITWPWVMAIVLTSAFVCLCIFGIAAQCHRENYFYTKKRDR